MPDRPEYDLVVAAAYEVTCTYQIQSSAVPAIERLGLAPLLAQAGAPASRT